MTCQRIIEDMLAAGEPRDVRDINAACTAAGYSDATIKNTLVKLVGSGQYTRQLQIKYRRLPEEVSRG